MQKLFVTLAVLSAAIPVVYGNPDQRPEPNSFLNKPAHSTTQLVAHVRQDPVVAARFMRHFVMNRQELLTYLGTLRLVRLPEDGHYKVYNVHPDGVVRSRMFHLKKGTLMWAEPDGRLVLKKGCGNPLATGPLLAASNPKSLVEKALVAQEEVLEVPVEPEPEPLELMPMAEVLEPAFTTPSEEPVVEVLPSPPTPAQVIGGGGNPILGGLILPFLFGNSGGGDPVIPEPATIVSLSVPVIVTLLARRRK